MPVAMSLAVRDRWGRTRYGIRSGEAVYKRTVIIEVDVAVRVKIAEGWRVVPNCHRSGNCFFNYGAAT